MDAGADDQRAIGRELAFAGPQGMGNQSGGGEVGMKFGCYTHTGAGQGNCIMERRGVSRLGHFSVVPFRDVDEAGMCV